MAYTSHGHHIEGTPDEEPRPHLTMRCGGPGVCKMCSAEAWQVKHKRGMITTTIINDPVLPEISSIPPAPLSDEDIRIEAISLAVDWTARTTSMTSGSLISIAKDIQEYIRPSTT